jgi:hypothetical protein
MAVKNKIKIKKIRQIKTKKIHQIKKLCKTKTKNKTQLMKILLLIQEKILSINSKLIWKGQKVQIKVIYIIMNISFSLMDVKEI